ncbi:MAG: HlyD family efflux transporter periplasmic adaptor subunit [Planctomycetota bacterium]
MNGQPTLASRLQSVQTRLHPSLEITRHQFRGEPTYVVRNMVNFKSHRLSSRSYQIMVALDGERTLGDTFELLVKEKQLSDGDENDFYQLVLSFHQLGLLNLPVSDGQELYARFKQLADQKRKSRWMSFLFWQIPLFNPDPLLERTWKFFRPLYSSFAFLIYLIFMSCCAAVLWQRWHDFTEPLQSILTVKNLVGMWVLLVGLKIIHEFGHAYACKVFGGTVPEMGAFMICFTPCAYVDASSAWGFEKKRHRIAVSLAGMYFESICAGIALMVWHSTGESFLHSYAHQVVILASIVTIGFNINPLMKFDGYYVLSDWLEIPNLREQSTMHLQRLLKRVFLGLSSEPSPFPKKIRLFLVVYGCFVTVWKCVITIGICAAVALKIYFVGLLMAAVFAALSIGGAFVKLNQYLFHSQETAPVRRRALVCSAATLTCLLVVLFVIPIRMDIEVPGVVYGAEYSTVHSAVSGFVTQRKTPPGESIERGQVLCTLSNEDLHQRVRRLEAEIRVLELKADIELEDANVNAALRVQANHLEEQLEHARRQLNQLSVKTPLDGVLLEYQANCELGQFVNIGQPIAVVASDHWQLHAYARDDSMSSWSPRIGQTLKVRLLGDVTHELEGTISSVSAKGTKEVKDATLTQLGGGTIPVVPDTMMSNETYFEFTVNLRGCDQSLVRQGMTAIVQCPADYTLVGLYGYRVFLRFFNRL